MQDLKPNLFIIGAAKCGTTAISTYLGTHPDFFICDPKEPHYFASDMPNHRYVNTLKEYLALYSTAQPNHTVLADASVCYISSEEALKNIHQFNPNAKIIAMVRNPLEMVISMHRQIVYAGFENEADFEKAWNLQASRKNGIDIPTLCRTPQLLQYQSNCELGRQIKRLYEIFPSKQIKVIVFDDFIQDTQGIYSEVLSFLALTNDNRNDFPVINEAKQMRFKILGLLISAIKPLSVKLALLIKQYIGLNLLPLMQKLQGINVAKVEKLKLQDSFKAELIDCFRDDVLLLSKQINRDLSTWLR